MGCRHRGRRGARPRAPRRAVSRARRVAPRRLLGEGWDNSVWVVEERWAFRFPRREIAIAGVARELAVLPRLAPLLPVPIPAPQLRRGAETSASPGRSSARRSFSATSPPTRADRRRPRRNRRRARTLPPRAAFAGNAGRGRPPARAAGRLQPSRRHAVSRVARARASSPRLRTRSLAPARRSSSAILADAEGLPPVVRGPSARPRRPAHPPRARRARGDLAASSTGATSASAIPSIDLMLVWMLLPPAGRERFFVDVRPGRRRAAAASSCPRSLPRRDAGGVRAGRRQRAPRTRVRRRHSSER